MDNKKNKMPLRLLNYLGWNVARDGTDFRIWEDENIANNKLSISVGFDF